MGFLATLRVRITEAVSQHPDVRTDPLFGRLEQAGEGLWQTTQPVPLVEGTDPISVMVQGDPDSASRETFEELGRRYNGLKASIGPMLCKAAPRVRAKCLWEHATLASAELWREPGTNKPVIALEFELDDDPEYAYVVRVENWRAVEVLVVG
jgi:hypothetical protein